VLERRSRKEKGTAVSRHAAATLEREINKS
jgi:hypothetical protein